MKATAVLPMGKRRLVHGYLVEETLGRGAFGTVHRVRKDRGGAQSFALKEIPLQRMPHSGARGQSAEESAAEQSRRVAELCSEVNILSQLSHPNIVRYHTSFVEDGCLFIVMELVHGHSLLELLTSLHSRGGRLSEEDVWQLFLQLVLAVSYLHEDKEVIHRDLTCSNVMVNRQRQIKVMDMGLALQRRGDGQTGEGRVGNVAFCAPELLTAVGERGSYQADMWSLGCVLYYMVTGKTAFRRGEPPDGVPRESSRECTRPSTRLSSPPSCRLSSPVC